MQEAKIAPSLNAYIVGRQQADHGLLSLAGIVTKLGYDPVFVGSLEHFRDNRAFLNEKDPLVIIPLTHTNGLPIRSIVQFASQNVSKAFVIYVASELNSDEYKSLVRTGSADCVFWKTAESEIAQIVRKRRAKSAPLSTPTRPNNDQVHLAVGFVPAAGGVGNTTCLLETGVCLAIQGKAGAPLVNIVDLDFNNGSICDYVDHRPNLDLVRLAQDPDRLDDYMLDIFSIKHRSGLDIFASKCDISMSEAEIGSAVFPLLNKITLRYNITLLDIPGRFSAIEAGILPGLDFVFIVGTDTVPGLKKIGKRLASLLEAGVAQNQIGVVFNRSERRILSGFVRKSFVTKANLPKRHFFVREDRSFALECVNLGTSLMQANARRGICRDIKQVASFIRDLANPRG